MSDFLLPFLLGYTAGGFGLIAHAWLHDKWQNRHREARRDQ